MPKGSTRIYLHAPRPGMISVEEKTLIRNGNRTSCSTLELDVLKISFGVANQSSREMWNWIYGERHQRYGLV